VSTDFYSLFARDPEPKRELASVTPLDPERGSRYAIKALRSECENVASAPEGTRNHALNRAAFSIAQLVAGGYLGDDDARNALRDAARSAGLTDHEIEATIGSGFRSGQQTPRVVEDKPLEAPAVTTLADQAAAEGVDVSQVIRDKFPVIDWHTLWNTEDEDEEWIVEPLLPARRLVALFSAPKVGKSLLMLEIAAAVAAGTPVLGVTPDRPRRVLYVDFENDPRGDVRTRLKAMGLGPDDLTNLQYLSYPTLAKLDTPTGAAELLAIVEEYECELVVIDTISRAVGGEENENDTWLAFYRNTGLALKQAKVACIRLDHTGKDHDKGMRGGSAKYGDVDAVWKLSRVDDGDTYKLECTDHRMPIDEPMLVIHRDQEPLTHRVSGMGRPALTDARVAELVKTLDELDVDPTLGRDKVRDILKEYNVKAENASIGKAQETRRLRLPRGFEVGS
jgi:hypothetical protein